MLFFKSLSKISLLTATSIISSIFVTNLPAKAATFSSSEAILFLNNFSITPQNPAVETNTQTVTVSRNDIDIAEANAKASSDFEANSDVAFLFNDLSTDAFGYGNKFFGFGEASSFAVGNFAIDANETLSFDFITALSIENKVDSPLDGSVSTFNGINFLLFDENSNYLLGDFTAISNVDTNLAEGVDNDFISVDGTNVTFNGSKFEDFGGNIESADLVLSGSFEQFFDRATEVTLAVTTLSRSCVQASVTKDPCVNRIPEPDNTATLLVGLLGLGMKILLSGKRDKVG